MKKYIVNHVMSRDIDSGIFKSIIGYMREYSPANIVHVETITPLENADVYHYHRPHLEKKLLPRSICTIHHDLNDPDVWHARQFFVPRYRESVAIICLNHTQKNILTNEEGINDTKLHVIPHGYNNKVLYPKEKVKSDKFTLGIASKRYGRRVKGESYMLDLVKRLDPDLLKFILVGTDREIDALCFRKLGFNVDVYELLPYRLFNTFYQNIHALLMCSSHEGGPANVPEALATNTPLFTTPIAMSLDYIINHQNGIFLTLDPNTDASNIMTLASDEDAYERMLYACKNNNKNILTWKEVVHLNHQVYDMIINSTK